MILKFLMVVKFFILSFQLTGSIQMIITLLSNGFEHRVCQFQVNNCLLHTILDRRKACIRHSIINIRLNQCVPEIPLMLFV